MFLSFQKETLYPLKVLSELSSCLTGCSFWPIFAVPPLFSILSAPGLTWFSFTSLVISSRLNSLSNPTFTSPSQICIFNGSHALSTWKSQRFLRLNKPAQSFRYFPPHPFLSVFFISGDSNSRSFSFSGTTLGIILQPSLSLSPHKQSQSHNGPLVSAFEIVLEIHLHCSHPRLRHHLSHGLPWITAAACALTGPVPATLALSWWFSTQPEWWLKAQLVLCHKPAMALPFIQVKALFWKAPHDRAPVFLPPHLQQFLPPLLFPHWPPCSSWNTVSWVPECLCTRGSLRLKSPPSGYQHAWLTPTFQVFLPFTAQ